MKKFVIYALVIMLMLFVGCQLEHPKVPTPTANITSSAVYMNSKDIVLTCENPNADIYYTVDGSDPVTSETRKKYSGTVEMPYAIPGTKTIKIYATLKRNEPSDVAEYICPVYIEGPAGGIVFYDKSVYSDGWRYMEVAPEDMTDGSISTFVSGFYRTSSDGSNLYVNGSSSYVEGTSSATDGKSTGIAIGTGKANTAKLVSKMGSSAYAGSSGTETTSNYAAKLCDDYTYGGFNDWFLPSKNELNLLYVNLHQVGLGGFGTDTSYCTSSEMESTLTPYLSYVNYIWAHFFLANTQGMSCRDTNLRVRAIRTF